MSVLTAAPRSQTVRGALNIGGLATIAAGLGNLLALVIGRLAGADMSVLQPGATEAIEIGVVIVALGTVVPFALGTATLALTTRWGRRGWTAVAWLGLAVGLLTTVSPFTVEASTSTSATLAAMHVVSGVVWFVLVRRSSSQPA
ncbi:hypothetical protein SAMN05192558_101670 [Actinokineospora alba]|uniref:Uncharacterized protein n=1 Tax=Actinokineospora alba TaxID=504798 RepID=A0A1H0G5L1_9PSEU|nr:DUF6069 family protein [Actinokineospora alba]TDP69771.1 hypothetical protein C8E96_5365 [Actinokineospora alba]SDI09105.1 hypothetical protein SAMN05421871_103201 [Actinokineospora alba]SDO02124.1 hypothetical protein SAMN05192558_101670 [Actinokineospora alba]